MKGRPGKIGCQSAMALATTYVESTREAYLLAQEEDGLHQEAFVSWLSRRVLERKLGLQQHLGKAVVVRTS